MRWYIAPRAANVSRGESVVFNLPQVGDAEAYASEVMASVTNLDQFLDQFLSIHDISVDKGPLNQPGEIPYSTTDLCKYMDNGIAGELFLKELYCRAIVKIFAKVIAATPPGILAPDTKKKLSEFAYRYTMMNQREVMPIITHFDLQWKP